MTERFISPGQAAYETYAQELGWYDIRRGEPLDEWHHLTADEQRAWYQAARAAGDALRRLFHLSLHR